MSRCFLWSYLLLEATPLNRYTRFLSSPGWASRSTSGTLTILQFHEGPPHTLLLGILYGNRPCGCMTSKNIAHHHVLHGLHHLIHNLHNGIHVLDLHRSCVQLILQSYYVGPFGLHIGGLLAPPLNTSTCSPLACLEGQGRLVQHTCE